MEGKRKQGRQKKWEDNVRESTGVGFSEKRRGRKTMLENGEAWSFPNPRGKLRAKTMQETGCAVISSALTTLHG